MCIEMSCRCMKCVGKWKFPILQLFNNNANLMQGRIIYDAYIITGHWNLSRPKIHFSLRIHLLVGRKRENDGTLEPYFTLIVFYNWINLFCQNQYIY